MITDKKIQTVFFCGLNGHYLDRALLHCHEDQNQLGV